MVSEKLITPPTTGRVRRAKTSHGNPTFLVSRAGGAYDAGAGGPNWKFRLKTSRPSGERRAQCGLLHFLYEWHGKHHTAHITELRKQRGWLNG
jgi:hypothetical protein